MQFSTMMFTLSGLRWFILLNNLWTVDSVQNLISTGWWKEIQAQTPLGPFLLSVLVTVGNGIVPLIF